VLGGGDQLQPQSVEQQPQPGGLVLGVKMGGQVAGADQVGDAVGEWFLEPLRCAFGGAGEGGRYSVRPGSR
jgi:hypothetical protein